MFRAPMIAPGPLTNRNPSIKLLVLTVISVLLMFVFDPTTPAVLYAVSLFVVLLSYRGPKSRVIKAHLPFYAFGFGVFMVNTLTRPGEVLWQAGILRITAEGLSVGSALALRTMLIGILAVAFMLSTDGERLMASLHQNLRLGSRITFAVLAGYRMLQDLPREWTTIRQAHAVRAPDRGRGFSRSPKHLAKVVFALLVVSIRKSERMSQTLESRGLGLTPRTIYRPIPITGTDWWFAAVTLTAVLVVLGASMYFGVWQGPGALSS